jgi:hypothetical protein
LHYEIPDYPNKISALKKEKNIIGMEKANRICSMKGNKGEDKLTIKKSAQPGIDFFFSLRHVIAAVNIGEIRNIQCHEGIFSPSIEVIVNK